MGRERGRGRGTGTGGVGVGVREIHLSANFFSMLNDFDLYLSPTRTEGPSDEA